MRNPENILRLHAVKARCGLSRSTIYLRVASGDFPSPISLGARSIGWLESEVNAWIAARIAGHRKAQHGGEAMSLGK